jgi:hypothetical protein
MKVKGQQALGMTKVISNIDSKFFKFFGISIKR